MPHMTQKQEKSICEMIDRWPLDGKLTWPNIITMVEKRFRIKFTRQTLSVHDSIAISYRTRKELIKQQKKRRYVPKSMSLQTALETVEKREGKNALLKAENKALKEQFARWATNAKNYGMSFDFLNKPLPTNIQKKKGDNDE